MAVLYHKVGEAGKVDEVGVVGEEVKVGEVDEEVKVGEVGELGSMPHICHFWYATIFFRPEKVRQKSAKICDKICVAKNQ